MAALTILEGSESHHWLTAVVDSMVNAVEVVIALLVLPPFINLQQWLRAPKLIPRFTIGNISRCTRPRVLCWQRHTMHSPGTTRSGTCFTSGRWRMHWDLHRRYPLVLALRAPASWSTKQPAALLRSALMLVVMTAATIGVFLDPQSSPVFILFPLLALLIFYSGFTGAMLAIESICCVSVYLTLHGSRAQHSSRFYFPSTHLTSHDHSVLFLQLLLGLIVLIGFSAAVLLAERRAFAGRLQASERQYRSAG